MLVKNKQKKKEVMIKMKVVISWKCETARSDRWCAPLHLRKLIMFRMTMMIRRMFGLQ